MHPSGTRRSTPRRKLHFHSTQDTDRKKPWVDRHAAACIIRIDDTNTVDCAKHCARSNIYCKHRRQPGPISEAARECDVDRRLSSEPVPAAGIAVGEAEQ